MKKILRKAMNLLGEKQRLQIYRKMASIPAEYYNPEFRVEIARTQSDLERAYALLHDCYVGINIIDPQPSGLRCNLFSFLPTSTIIVAKLGDRVVGTVSAIKDSKSGLPSDNDFLKENNQFRQQGKILVEASALAVDPEFRGNHSVSLLLMKYFYLYSKLHFQADFAIGVVHPRAEDFYKALWQFKKNGDTVKYNSLKGAAAIHLSMDLSCAHFKKIVQDFGPDIPTKNLGSMIKTEDPRFFYPQQKTGQSIHPVITPELLKYFCLQKKEVWARMTTIDRKKLVEVYTTYFGADVMKDFKENRIPIQAEKEYRSPVQLASIVSIDTQSSFSEILDLTAGGCFIGWDGDLPSADQEVALSFRFEERNYVLRGKVAWQNDSQCLRRRRGFGIRFANRMPSLNSQLQAWLYDSEATSPRVGQLGS
ncbi:MAG: N-acyl amino acid synthase FeeM domain-containing protein [Pseudobdellovibrionaceae bacterium]